MRNLTIKISDGSAAVLERSARSRGLALEHMVAAEVESRVVEPLKRNEQGWMPRTRWEELVRGDGCPACAALGDERHNDGYYVADLGIARLRLMRNQFLRGYSVLTCREHVSEFYELNENKRQRFFDDLTTTGRAIATVVQPAKMNFEILGNRVPHLHCHIKPRSFGDSAPGIPIDQNAGQVELSDQEYQALILAIRSHLT